jgi:hypothetical protein
MNDDIGKSTARKRHNSLVMTTAVAKPSGSVLSERASTAKPRHVHFIQPHTHESREIQESIARAHEERDRKERDMLKTFEDVLTEEFSTEMLDGFLLYRATMDPQSIRAFLLVRNTTTGAVEGIVRYLRDQMFPEVGEETWNAWVVLLNKTRDEDLFWSFVIAMSLDEGVKNMVASTWKGSQRALECIFDYYAARMNSLLESPFDPKNANTIMTAIWGLIRMEVVCMNMRAIIMNGTLLPVIVPLSRNAHRVRRQEMKQANFENMMQLTTDGLS